jgi:hypothetical protein
LSRERSWEDWLKGRTAGDVPEMLNEISSSSRLSLSPFPCIYTNIGKCTHGFVCVCVCGAFLFIPSSSTSLHHFLFFLSLFVVCVFFFFVFAKDWETCAAAAAGCTMHPSTLTILLHTDRRFCIYRLISSDQLANGILLYRNDGRRRRREEIVD